MIRTFTQDAQHTILEVYFRQFRLFRIYAENTILNIKKKSAAILVGIHHFYPFPFFLVAVLH